VTRRFLHIASLVVFAALTGCDDDPTTRLDDELIVGTWEGETMNARTVIGLSVPVLDLEEGGDVARFTFEEDGTYAFLFDPADGRTLEIPETDVSIPLEGTVSFSGNYTLDEADGTIFLSASTNLPVGLTLEYDFDGDDALEVIADDPETLGALVGLATDSPELELLASVVTGGSIRYRRSS
jgi:hypothetical protein